MPETRIELGRASLVLYPQADPEAVWSFGAESVDYLPNSRETTLHTIDQGERRVAGELDFTLQTDAITIDNQDNLRGERVFVHLIRDNWDLDMQADGDRLVLIDQQSGTFEVPVLDYTGDGIGQNHNENVRVSFDLERFEAGGPGTIGYNQFEAGR